MVVEQNPYAPTKAALNEVSPEEEAPSGALEPAPRWRRLANLLLDFVGIVLTAMLFGLLLGAASVAMHIDVAQYTGRLYGWTVVFLYYLVSEALFGRTLGKLVTDTRVVAESGGRPAFWQILARSIYRFVPLEPFSLFNRHSIAWHDRWSKTRVVRTRGV
jgi:uncharacterized RDD family membrane protein YckC